MGKETILYALMILLQAGVIIYFVRRNRMLKRQVGAKETMPDTDSYQGLRNLAINVTSAQLKLTIPGDETLVYGVVMDCDLGDVIVTLTAYITGAANVYFSTGGGKTGGGKSPAVGEAAVELVTTAQGYVTRAIRVSTTEECDKGCVRFYLLTNKGIYAAQEQLLHIQDGTSAWIRLFEKGNEMVNLMRNSGNGSISH
jgi:hypothetical protein